MRQVYKSHEQPLGCDVAFGDLSVSTVHDFFTFNYYYLLKFDESTESKLRR